MIPARDVQAGNTYIVTLQMRQFVGGDMLTNDETNVIKMFVRSVIPNMGVLKDAEIAYHNTLSQVIAKITDCKPITLRIEGVRLKRANDKLNTYIKARRKSAIPLELRLTVKVFEEPA